MDMVVVLPFFKERYSSGGDLRPQQQMREDT